MFPHTSAPPETIRAVSFLARPRRTRDNPATRVQEPLGSEHCGVVVIGRRVIVVTIPEIRKAQRSLGDEHPIVPVIFRRGVWESERKDRAPSKELFDYCLYVRKARSVRKCRGARPPGDNSVQLGLGAPLYFRMRDHCECLPM